MELISAITLRAAMFGLGWLFKKKPAEPAPFNFEKAKTRCRILVLDDDVNAVPIEELKRDGYNIEQYFKVDPTLLSQMERGTFDIIFLDYTGIAPKSITKDDGFGIFDRVRSSNPSQYIIAISGQTWDISKSDYFNKANSRIAKPTSLTETKQKIDEAINKIFNENYLYGQIEDLLRKKNLQERQVTKVIDTLKSTTPSFERFESIVRGALSVASLTSDITSLLALLFKVKGGD